jgi:hypothetical protein
MKPIYPDTGHPAYYTPKVVTLEPVLKWKRETASGATYDLVIFEGPDSNGAVSFDWLRNRPSKVVYQRSNLTGSEHKVEEPLTPGKIYFWSIRRSGEENKWSSYNYHLFSVIMYNHWLNIPFRFETPK